MGSQGSASRFQKVVAALGVLVLALGVYRIATGSWRQPAGELGFFYDVSAARIFSGPRTAPPPIRGVDGPDEDAFRAVVVSTSGRPADRSTWKVAYLEKFSPELKERTATAQRSGESLAMGRMEVQAHRFVRRLDETTWHPMSSEEAEVILSEWTKLGTEGAVPVLCTP
ncbi:MAG: hypothetical protein IT580_04570 [Verrucomicrobiales bacterium]|jgi:hypothetical protein|nr:hypothetical protein [Verrucomicrobiales bacterium]